MATWTLDRLKALEEIYIKDRARGLLTLEQLNNMLYRLDRIAATLHD